MLDWEVVHHGDPMEDLGWLCVKAWRFGGALPVGGFGTREELFQAYEDLEVGGVIAGDVPSFRIDQMPYGGVKDSGLGREGLRYAIEEMTEPKLLVMNLR